MRKFLTSMGMALAVTFAAPAAAMTVPPGSSPAFEFNGADIDPGEVVLPRTIGFSFTLSRPVTVTALGYWSGSDTGVYQVGLWGDGGAELARSTVCVGCFQSGGDPTTEYTYGESFRLLLAPGTYVLGGENSGGSFPFNLTGLSTAPGYVYGQVRESAAGSGFTRPDTSFSDSQGFFGPQSFALVNFAFEQVSAVPEPATWAMMLLGFGVIGTSLRRRRKALAIA